jgi:hypothetical protein
MSNEPQRRMEVVVLPERLPLLYALIILYVHVRLAGLVSFAHCD